MGRSRKRNRPLSPEVRAAIWRNVVAGEKKTVIARCFNISRPTIYRIIKRFSKRHDFKSNPIAGRPRSTNPREERYLVQLTRKVPDVSLRTLVQLSGINVSVSTAKRILRRHHIRKCRSRRRPKLTPLRAKKRREFCRFWKGREAELASVCKP